MPFAEIRVGKDREARVEEPLNRLDFQIWHDVESVPALAEHAHQPARPVDLEIARLVHRVAKEEVAPEHRDASEAADSAALGPCLECGEERIEARRGELIMDALLAIAVRPEDVPAMGCGFRSGF